MAILYLNEHGDARETIRVLKGMGRKTMSIAGDIGDEKFCRRAIARVVQLSDDSTSPSITPPSSTRRIRWKRSPPALSSHYGVTVRTSLPPPGGRVNSTSDFFIGVH